MLSGYSILQRTLIDATNHVETAKEYGFQWDRFARNKAQVSRAASALDRHSRTMRVG